MLPPRSPSASRRSLRTPDNGLEDVKGTHLFGVEQQRPRSRAGEEGTERRGDLGVVTKGVFVELAMERRGVFAVLGVSKMREELGEGQGVEEGVQNTW